MSRHARNAPAWDEATRVPAGDAPHTGRKNKTRAPKPPRDPKPHKAPFAIQEIFENLTITGDDVIAWYVLPLQSWSFRSTDQRFDMVSAVARCFASLVGHRVYFRGTTRPYPTVEWARNLHEDTIRAVHPSLLPGTEGNTWNDHLMRVQRHLRNITLDDKAVFFGVRVASRSSLDRLIAKLTRSTGKNELERLRGQVAVIDEIVARQGLSGRPAAHSEVEYLMHRSVALGLPEPVSMSAAVRNNHWYADDLGEFAESVSYQHDLFAPTTIVRALRGDTVVEQHVSILTVGRVESIDVPAGRNSPWMQVTDLLPFPVEWMCTLDLLDGDAARAKVNKSLLQIRDLQNSYADHGLDEPLDLESKAQRAREIEQDLTDGDEVESGRAHGWFRIAVTGNTEKQCVTRARDIVEVFKPLRIAIQHPHGPGAMANQYGLLREFIPGEPLSSTAYRRELPLLALAAGMPTVSAQVGDRRGPYIGYTSGTSRRAVMHNSHEAMERQETSGQVAILGGLGAGKSVLLGQLCYEAARRGVMTTILDPSGPLAKLTMMPEFAGRARAIDLLTSPPGTLNPYEVVKPPRGSEFHQQSDEFREAVAWAMQARKALATDVINMLLPLEVKNHWSTPLVLQAAIRAVEPASEHASLFAVLEALRNDKSENAGHARMIADYLEASTDMPGASLFFGRATTDKIIPQDDLLLVVTMPGLELPPKGVDPEHWTYQQRMSQPLLHLAAHYVTSRVYGSGRDSRKALGFDEIGQMGSWGSGTALMNRVNRDSRKWNLATYLSSQDPEDVLNLNIKNKISGAFVGRIEDRAVAAQALDLIGIPTNEDTDYTGVVAGLSPFTSGLDGTRRRVSRDFLYRDVAGSVERIRIDLAHNPALLDALDTTAKPQNVDQGAAA
jgi:hypothetical protein